MILHWLNLQTTAETPSALIGAGYTPGCLNIQGADRISLMHAVSMRLITKYAAIASNAHFLRIFYAPCISLTPAVPIV